MLRFTGWLMTICFLCGSAGLMEAAATEFRIPGVLTAKKDKEKQEKVLKEKEEQLEAREKELKAKEEALAKEEGELKNKEKKLNQWEDRLKRRARRLQQQTQQGVGAGTQAPSGNAAGFGPKTAVPPQPKPENPLAPQKPPAAVPGPPMKQ
ncbi:MAG: hypothetical protein HY879_02620 [Deltaproteobacteria bacterium]|nr:hypothetical protein [Deltaproteobacteria bacterium]